MLTQIQIQKNTNTNTNKNAKTNTNLGHICNQTVETSLQLRGTLYNTQR